MHPATLILRRCSRIAHDLAVLLFNLCHCPGITLMCYERLVVVCGISPHGVLLPTLIPAPQTWKYFSCFFCSESVSKIKHSAAVSGSLLWMLPFDSSMEGRDLPSALLLLQVASSPSFLSLLPFPPSLPRVLYFMYACILYYVCTYFMCIYIHVYQNFR